MCLFFVNIFRNDITTSRNKIKKKYFFLMKTENVLIRRKTKKGYIYVIVKGIVIINVIFNYALACIKSLVYKNEY